MHRYDVRVVEPTRPVFDFELRHKRPDGQTVTMPLRLYEEYADDFQAATKLFEMAYKMFRDRVKGER